MSYALNNVATLDNYDTSTALKCPNTIKLNIWVLNAAIYFQCEDPSAGTAPGSGPLKPEVFLPPGYFPLVRNTNFVQIRSAVAKTPAQVTIEALNPSD